MYIIEWIKGAYQRLFGAERALALVFFVASGIVYLIVFCVLCGAVRRIRQKRRRETPQRKLEFTLPDRENTYVRARLGTVLNSDAALDEEREEALTIGFSHVEKLLEKVRLAPLSLAERLEINELRVALEGYFQKSRFSGKDVRALNDAFSRLVKLSAKYAV